MQHFLRKLSSIERTQADRRKLGLFNGTGSVMQYRLRPDSILEHLTYVHHCNTIRKVRTDRHHTVVALELSESVTLSARGLLLFRIGRAE